MTFNPQETEAFQQNWDKVRPQLQQAFPNIDTAQLEQDNPDPAMLVTQIATQTGQSEEEVATQVRSITSQFTPESTS